MISMHEISDTLVDVLLEIIHRRVRAERKVTFRLDMNKRLEIEKVVSA